MALQADFTVRNVLKRDGDINVISKQPDGTDKITTIAHGKGKQIPIQGPEVSLLIKAPENMDTKDCYVLVNSDVDLNMAYSRTSSNWTINIVPNELPPFSPTTVNVDVGEEKPG
ncbi:MAG: hypothetical protein PVH61_08870 [Candidatus Aminicenantes bacterium]|jgi:hypothetical protein